jgi:alkylated DNA repair protein (DNA oxidative demethylase)
MTASSRRTSQNGAGRRWMGMVTRAPTTRRNGARSRRGGRPVTLPPPHPIPPVRPLPLPDERSGQRRDVLPGVIHIPGWLDADAQAALVADFREWARPPAGLRHPRVPTGHLMTVQSVCLGWHWSPYAYSRTADDTDGADVKPMPDHVARMGRAAVDASYGADAGAAYRPDAAIVNLYPPGAKLGLHQDGEEPAAAPVVTISIGDTCTFRMAGVDRRTGPFVDVELRSGDLLVFGGPNRRIFHGVPKVRSGTAPDDLGLPPGRLSLTLRETGLT